MILLPEPVQFLFELLLAELLFLRGLQRRERFFLRLVVGLCFLLLFSVIWPAGWSGFPKVFKYLITFCLSVVFLWQLFRISVWEAVFIGTAAYAVQHIAYNLAIPVFLFMSFPPTAGGRFLFAGCMTAVYAAVYLTAHRCLGRKLRLSEIRVSENRSLILFVISILTVVVFLNYARFLDKSDSSPILGLILIGYSVTSCVFALFIQFFVVQRLELRSRLEITEQLLHTRQNQFLISEQTIEYINIKCHDLKHQLFSLRQGIHDPATADGIKEVEDSVMIYDSFIRTGNEALDVILTEKSLLCHKYDIQLTCMADGKALNRLHPADLYSLFGNILDNAIESVSGLKDHEKRIIGLTVQNTGNLITIHSENYFDHPVRIKDGLPETTKQDTRYHGFGLRSIQLIAEKYGGSLSVFIDGSIFNLNLLIPCTGGHDSVNI